MGENVLNCNTLRLAFIADVIERVEGKFDWSLNDARVKAYLDSRCGIELLGVIAFNRSTAR